MLKGGFNFCAQLQQEGAAMTKKLLAPISPGEILLEEFMKPLGISN